jgi:hypothetical protein
MPLTVGQTIDLGGVAHFTLSGIDYGSGGTQGALLPQIVVDGTEAVVALKFGVGGPSMTGITTTATITAVPEPSTLAMLLAALPLAYLAYRRR